MKTLAWLGLALLVATTALGVYWLVPRSPELPATSGALVRDSLVWNGHSRSFSWYRPQQARPGAELVIALHGSMGDGDQARAGYGYEFDLLADQEGFIVVYPDGFENHWNGCRRAGPYSANTLAIDDVGFLSSLIDYFTSKHGIDRGQVFVTGISNGGHMALRIALEAPDLVTAVAPVIASLPVPDNNDCRATGRPVSLLLMNGTAAPMNPYNGGKVALYGRFGDRGEVMSTGDTMAYFAALAGFEQPSSEISHPDRQSGDDKGVTETRWSAPGRKRLSLFTIHGGGHTVPHPDYRAPRLLGPTNHDIIAAREIWSFFKLAPRRDSAASEAGNLRHDGVDIAVD
jgi:polyhydroxybutyrate depolymerase